ncbi:MATE family efflux transporter [Maritimibacter sp. 55A14]|uniref:MATE family efflux transporter n=1 Tax=Maritimibacter sp. 55A14 TaxID=2174844 RepID=UPI000D60C80D|nr:MATE family efflux transporter [Maritimibacter sp. 55A14]PWE32335.1 MATE family efflux transporter [Maritimibacter sp. 55A14]
MADSSAEAEVEVALGPLTHRRVLHIALPIVLSNATVPILGAVDTGVVGQLGEAAPIGAVGIGAIVITALYWIFGFLRMGTSGLAAQARGRRDRAELLALLTRTLLIGGAAGCALVALQGPIFWGAFRLSPATSEVEALARDYMGIRIFSAPAAIALFGVTGWLIALERTRAVLALQLWMNGVNIGLDLVFVLGLGWGVSGVALATLISEWSALGLGFWLCREALGDPRWRDWARVFDAPRLRQMVSVNTDILIRTLLLEGAFVSFLFFGADFGDVTLAANQILIQFLHVTAHALDGFAFAAEALVGHALGARARAALRRAALLTSFWGLVTVTLLAAGFAALGPWIIDVMTTAQPVRLEARGYLGWMILAPFVGIAAWMFDGIFIGATRTRDMRNMMLVSFVAYVVAVAALVPVFGNHGLWASLLVMFAVRGVTLGLKYPALEAAAET